MVDGVVTRSTPWLYFMHPQSEFKIRVQISYIYIVGKNTSFPNTPSVRILTWAMKMIQT